MPTLNLITIPAAQIRAGDQLDEGTPPGGTLRTQTVESVRNATKFVYVTPKATLPDSDEVLKGRKYLQDEMVSVYRMQNTPEEDYAEALRFVADTLRSTARHAIEKREQARAALVKTLTTDTERGPLPVDSWKLDEILNAQAYAAIWDEVNNWAVRGQGATSLQEASDEIVLKVVQGTRAELLKGMTEGRAFMRGASRSTSAASNLIEDYERDAAVYFLRSGSEAVTYLDRLFAKQPDL